MCIYKEVHEYKLMKHEDVIAFKKLAGIHEAEISELSNKERQSLDKHIEEEKKNGRTTRTTQTH